jgi:hypothetical protein
VSCANIIQIGFFSALAAAPPSASLMLSAIERNDLLLLDPRLVLFPQRWWYPVTIQVITQELLDNSCTIMRNLIASKTMEIDELQ